MLASPPFAPVPTRSLVAVALKKKSAQEVSQPAIFVCSMAAVEKLRAEEGDAALDEATCAMGLSLGEYSALCFAGALSFEDGVKVTKARCGRRRRRRWWEEGACGDAVAWCAWREVPEGCGIQYHIAHRQNSSRRGLSTVALFGTGALLARE